MQELEKVNSLKIKLLISAGGGISDRDTRVLTLSACRVKGRKNAWHLPFENESVGVLTLEHCLETLQSPEELKAFLKEMQRVLAPGARVHLKARHPLHRSFTDDPACALRITDHSLQTLLTDGGAENFKELFTTLHLDPSFAAEARAHGWKGQRLDFEMRTRVNAVESTRKVYRVEKGSDFQERFPGGLRCYTEIPGLPAYPFTVYADFKSDSIVSREIALTGIWEGNETQIVARLLRALAQKYADRPLRFFNVGANIGWYSALALHCVDRVDVTAFEPVASTFALLKENCHALNAEQRVTLQHLALSDTGGRAQIFVQQGNFGGSSLIARNADDAAHAEEIELMSLRDYVRALGDTDPAELCDLLMMDIEGAEHKFFNGAGALFAGGFRPLICMEYSPTLLKAQGSDGTYVKDLADYGYSFYSLAAQGLTLIPITVDAILRRYAQILKSGDECFLNLLAVPSSVDLKALLSLRTS